MHYFFRLPAPSRISARPHQPTAPSLQHRFSPVPPSCNRKAGFVNLYGEVIQPRHRASPTRSVHSLALSAYPANSINQALTLPLRPLSRKRQLKQQAPAGSGVQSTARYALSRTVQLTFASLLHKLFIQLLFPIRIPQPSNRNNTLCSSARLAVKSESHDFSRSRLPRSTCHADPNSTSLANQLNTDTLFSLLLTRRGTPLALRLH